MKKFDIKSSFRISCYCTKKSKTEEVGEGWKKLILDKQLKFLFKCSIDNSTILFMICIDEETHDNFKVGLMKTKQESIEILYDGFHLDEASNIWVRNLLSNSNWGIKEIEEVKEIPKE